MIIGDQSNKKVVHVADTRIKRLKLILRCNQVLIHSSRCHSADCGLKACHKMKLFIEHNLSCCGLNMVSMMTSGAKDLCPVCKQLVSLYCFHAKFCKRMQCSVNFCLPIRRHLTRQRILQLIHEKRSSFICKKRLNPL